MKLFLKKYQPIFFLLLIFTLSLSLRLLGLNWDQSQHLHPDERFLTMLISDISLPSSLSQYFSTQTSPLNPYNHSNYQFFVYGTFPVFLIKFLSSFLNIDNYAQVFLLGRALSALFDSFIVLLLYKLSKNYWVPLFYALTLIPLQLSHFMTVDVYLSFFLLLSYYLLTSSSKNKSLFKLLLASLSFGIALASKISALYFLPLFGLTYFINFFNVTLPFKNKSVFLKTFPPKKLFSFFSSLLLVTLFSFASFRFFQPYAFISLFKLNPLYLENISTLKSLFDPQTLFPPSIQWLSKTPVLFSVKHNLLWGLGLPLSLLFFLSLFFFVKPLFNKKKVSLYPLILLFFIIFFFIFQGSQLAQNLRYFYPLYPYLFLFISSQLKHFSPKTLKIIFSFHLLLSLAFLNIYLHPHSRVQASSWIYQNIPPSSKIANEYWDDPLPLNLPGLSSSLYDGTMLPLYDPDSPQKWQLLSPLINSQDYLILSSNRLWASIPKVPDIYPQSTIYYHDLFSGNSNFKLVAKFVSYPGFYLPFLSSCYYFGPSDYPSNNSLFEIQKDCNYPGIYLRDDTSEESFTVYDHPQVLIFKNTQKP